MRIIGGRDYYDSARAYGQDDDVVFVRADHRKATSIGLTNGLHSSLQRAMHSSLGQYPNPWWKYGCESIYSKWWDGKQYRSYEEGDLINTMPVNVWFAGKHYGLLKTVHVEKNREKTDFLWNFDQYMKLVQKEKFKLNPELLDDTRKFFEPRNANRKELDILIENKISVAIEDSNTFDKSSANRYKYLWFINTDGLKDIGFQKIVDPYQAFQELSMFVGGVLPRSPHPMIDLSKNEKVMVAKHGMDKWSFRKQPKSMEKT